MDDILSVSQQFLQHTNSFESHIQFTAEGPGSKCSIPFLDTFISSGPSSTLLTSVYRKLTHTNQYLNWDSEHKLSAKYGVFNTLTHRVRTIYTNQQLLQEEE